MNNPRATELLPPPRAVQGNGIIQFTDHCSLFTDYYEN